jgi:hypothetical protein
MAYQGQTLSVGGVKYFETDYIVTNFNPENKAIYGDNPKTFKKEGELDGSYYVIGIKNKVLLAEAINTETAEPKCAIVEKRTFGSDSASGVVSTGKQDSSGKLIYNGGFRYQQDFTTTSPAKLKARGLIKAGPLATQYTTLQLGSEKLVNISLQDLLNRFNAWLASGVDNEQRDSGLQLYFQSPAYKNSFRTKIVTRDQLISLYTTYFMHEDELNREAITSISGTTGTAFYSAGNGGYGGGSIGLWKMYKNRGLSDDAIRRELLDSGYTQAQINIFRNQGSAAALQSPGGDANSGAGGVGAGAGGAGSGGRGGGGGTGGNRGIVDNGLFEYTPGVVSSIQIQRSRNIFADNATSDLIYKQADDASDFMLEPQMFQIYATASTTGATNYRYNRFVFDQKPNEVQYAGLGGEWVSVDRNGGFSFVDWKKFQLLTLSFSFVIANEDDGLLTHVEKKIETLRRIAQTPYPVTFYNFDDMFTSQFRYDTGNTPRGVQFVITDLSITAQRRNSLMQITRAQANITLQEFPMEKQDLISMPRLVHTPPNIPGQPSVTTEPSQALISENLSTGFIDEKWKNPPPTEPVVEP